jgi:hypothetical protein
MIRCSEVAGMIPRQRRRTAGDWVRVAICGQRAMSSATTLACAALHS